MFFFKQLQLNLPQKWLLYLCVIQMYTKSVNFAGLYFPYFAKFAYKFCLYLNINFVYIRQTLFIFDSLYDCKYRY